MIQKNQLEEPVAEEPDPESEPVDSEDSSDSESNIDGESNEILFTVDSSVDSPEEPYQEVYFDNSGLSEVTGNAGEQFTLPLNTNF